MLAGSFSEKLSVRDENDMPPTLVLDPLPSGIEMIEPDVAVSDHELIRQLEQCCVEWISTIQVSTKYIQAAKLVPDNASVCELPLEEVYFWQKRARYLEPLSQATHNKAGHIQWSIRVLSLTSSAKGEELRSAATSLRKLSNEATWNSKYLTILEKPFKTLASGSLKAIYTTIPGMSKTLKMVAQSSRFYSSVDRIEKLVERVTLALCVRGVQEANPSKLMRHYRFAKDFPVYMPAVQGIEVSEGHAEDEETPFDTLTRVMDTMERWNMCLTVQSAQQDPAGGRAGKPKSSWDALNREVLLERVDYIKLRCEEIRQIFHSVELCVRLLADSPSERKDGKTIAISGILQMLDLCSKKRVRPRVGVLPANVEYIFEPRCSSKWDNTLADIMKSMASLSR